MSKCRKRTRFENARDVLPPDLFAAVQDVVGEKSIGLWVPGQQIDAARARARRVLELHRHGTDTDIIAAEVGVTQRRVQQILAAHRGES